ncbi:MAG: hypothetical protein OXF01_18000 [Gemmatimonadetes bacterium]|nr:hypothetical protein [Gemmatimonadota bacterium]
MSKVHYVPDQWVSRDHDWTKGGPSCGNYQKGVFSASHKPDLVTCQKCRNTTILWAAEKSGEK